MQKILPIIKADLLRFGPACGTRLWLKIAHPRYIPVLLIRLSNVCYRHRLSRPLGAVFYLTNIFFFGLEVTPRCVIGPGLLIPHTSGIVIGAAEIGSNVTIFQGVTLGAKYLDLNFTKKSRPVLESNVVIGSGAKVLGGIHIGENSEVAANSLLTESIPMNSYAIGVPAVIRFR